MGRLQLILNELVRDLASIEAELATTRAFRANGGDDDEHDPDGIPLSSVLQRLEGQKARVVKHIRQAQGALVDFDHGTYGICKICLRPIPSGRLEIKPAASTCVSCAG